MNKRDFDPVPLFFADYKRLAKRYPSLRSEIEAFEEVVTDPNKPLLGTPVPGVSNLNGNRVYKCRLPNKSAGKGKSGGFRVIYYFVTTGEVIYPLTIYSKSDIDNIPAHELERIITEHLYNI